MSESEKKGKIQSSSQRIIPRDFPLRLSTKVIAINERELNEEIASSRVAALIYRNLNDPEMYSYFFDATKLLLTKEDTEKYAATMWAAMIWHQDEFPEYNDFMEAIKKRAITGHYSLDRTPHEVDSLGREFSEYAYLIGEVFIQMVRINSDLYNVLASIFTFVIWNEMSQYLDRKKERRRRNKSNIVEEKSAVSKRLYDDIVDYISYRGEFRSDTLNQKNPNEFILILADRMRSTRRYVIQDIMNKRALEKKKELERELREREASAEEIISAAEPFRRGLSLYFIEKCYNFKYLAVEKVRITLQVLAVSLGMGAVGTSFLGIQLLSLMEGIVIGALMTGFAKTICSRFFFSPFFPRDVTASLEKEVGAFTPIFRKFSLLQINSFMSKQIKDPENASLLHLLPEYVKYIFTVMPDRNDILLSKEEINEFMERMEVNLSKQKKAA